jgi:hypothetical protein
MDGDIDLNASQREGFPFLAANAMADCVPDAGEWVVLPNPVLAWTGGDRLGNLIQVTRGAFGMPWRNHVWKLSRAESDGLGRLVWTLIADNVSEIPAGSAITLALDRSCPELS